MALFGDNTVRKIIHEPQKNSLMPCCYHICVIIQAGLNESHFELMNTEPTQEREVNAVMEARHCTGMELSSHIVNLKSQDWYV